MDVKQVGSSLDALVGAFNSRISDLRELVIARNMYPASCVTDLSAIDTSLTAMELQVQAIKDRLREESDVFPKAKKLIEASLKQQKKLQTMSSYVPSTLPRRMNTEEYSRCSKPEDYIHDINFGFSRLEEEAASLPKEKKGRPSPPIRYITIEELESVPPYMKGRLTLEKINSAINDMAAYAEANAQLISAPKKKVAYWLELRDIAKNEGLKGKYFFLENDIKGPTLKLDNTGKSILTMMTIRIQRAISLSIFTLIIMPIPSFGGTGNNSSIPGTDPSPPPQNMTILPRNCSTDPVELIICSPILGQGPLWPLNVPCCGLLGLIGVELSACLCLALKLNILGWSTDLPVALDMLMSFCQFTIAPAFIC
ncbi:hypothetical protein QQ045_033416 [Rhodiola kirilowii]